jgi:hypothetical protein
MLKSSSLCLYSSNLGTFWLKIEQFWPFEEISIFSNSVHLEWRAGLSDTNLKGTHPSTFHILIFSSETTGPIATKLWWNGPWMAPFQKCVWWSRLPTKMAAKLKIEKRGDEILIVHWGLTVVKLSWTRISYFPAWNGCIVVSVLVSSKQSTGRHAALFRYMLTLIMI